MRIRVDPADLEHLRFDRPVLQFLRVGRRLTSIDLLICLLLRYNGAHLAEDFERPAELPVEILDLLRESCFTEAILEKLNDGRRHGGDQYLDVVEVVHKVFHRILLAKHGDDHEALAISRALKVQTLLHDGLEA